MAHFYVGNVNFESTANNQLVYSANVITVRIAGANVMTINSTGVSSSGLAVPDQLFATITSNLAIRANNSFIVTGAVAYRGNVTPTAIAANTADWSPGVGNVYNIRVSANNNTATSEYMITGMTAGTNGQLVAIHNIGDMGIWIRNEEAGSNGAILPANNTPSSTAANRFSLPNHFKLNGSQSATFYYDGVSSRWRLVDSAALAFDHKKALTKGFFAGGFNASPINNYVATADRTTYSSETTAAVPGANLSQVRGYGSSGGNACKGFISGGYWNNPTAQTIKVADRTTFSTEVTAAVTSANFSVCRGGPAGAGNACKAIFGGGFVPPALSATSERTFYATEVTTSVPGAALSQARDGTKAVGNESKGFYMGGRNASTPTCTFVATADRTFYATETTSAVPGANLSQARGGNNGAAGNSDKGFIGGGQLAAPVNSTVTADRVTYSTETTAAVVGANLSQARRHIGNAGNSCKGFFSGGSPAPGTSLATADRTTYTTEVTAAVVGANLSQTRDAVVGV